MPTTRGADRKARLRLAAASAAASDEREAAQMLATSRCRPSALPPKARRMLVRMSCDVPRCRPCMCHGWRHCAETLIEPWERTSNMINCIEGLRVRYGAYHTTFLENDCDNFSHYEREYVRTCFRYSRLARSASGELARLSLSCDALRLPPHHSPPCALSVSRRTRRLFDALMTPHLESYRARAAATNSPGSPPSTL